MPGTNGILKVMCIATALLAFIGGIDFAQQAAGCAFGSQTLSRHLEAYQSGTRSITICPGATAEICVRVDNGY